MFEFPKDWRITRLGALVEPAKPITYGIVQAGPHILDGIPYIRVSDMTGGSLSPTDMLRTSKEIAKKYRRSTVHCDDLVFALRGSPGLVLKVPRTLDGANLTQGTARISPKISEVHPDYLLWCIRSDFVQRDMQRRLKGSTFREIILDELAKVVAPLPPLPEQRKIAQILGTWDEAIATTEELIAALERRKQGLMQRLLTGQVRFGEFAKEGWRRVSLGDFLQPISRNETIQADKEYRLIGVRWYLQGAHIHNVLPGDGIITKSLSCIREGDVLYNKMWVSKNAFAVAKREHDGAYGSGEYPQFRAKKGLDIGFLEQAFHNPRFLHDATSLCRGTTGRIRLHPDDFLQLTMHLPSVEEQVKIASVLRMNDEEKTKAEAYLENLREQKKGLMQRLLTGQVRVMG